MVWRRRARVALYRISAAAAAAVVVATPSRRLRRVAIRRRVIRGRVAAGPVARLRLMVPTIRRRPARRVCWRRVWVCSGVRRVLGVVRHRRRRRCLWRMRFRLLWLALLRTVVAVDVVVANGEVAEWCLSLCLRLPRHLDLDLLAGQIKWYGMKLPIQLWNDRMQKAAWPIIS